MYFFRISTFWSLVANNHEDYTMFMTGTNPENLRLSLLDASDEEGIVLGIFYQSPFKLVVSCTCRDYFLSRFGLFISIICLLSLCRYSSETNSLKI